MPGRWRCKPPSRDARELIALLERDGPTRWRTAAAILGLRPTRLRAALRSATPHSGVWEEDGWIGMMGDDR